jgi:hypothetical protein
MPTSKQTPRENINRLYHVRCASLRRATLFRSIKLTSGVDMLPYLVSSVTAMRRYLSMGRGAGLSAQPLFGMGNNEHPQPQEQDAAGDARQDVTECDRDFAAPQQEHCLNTER